MLKVIKEAFIVSLKVLTNVSLFILNMRSKYFVELFLSFIIILASINYYSLNKKFNFISRQR